MKARSYGLTLIDGADHSMNVEGDLFATLEAISKITHDVIEFLLEEQ